MGNRGDDRREIVNKKRFRRKLLRSANVQSYATIIPPYLIVNREPHQKQPPSASSRFPALNDQREWLPSTGGHGHKENVP